MSEEEKAPKKAARKRVVKKGVRGQRAPRKKTIEKDADDSAEAHEDSTENISHEENEITYELDSGQPDEPSGEIEVVADTPSKPERERPKKGNSKKEGSKNRDEKSRRSTESEEENSGEEGDDRGEGRNRRGRNRRGGNNRDDSSGAKGRPIDKDEAAAKAWEIYQGELEEEGVSLVDPRRAREVARRCLELATVFCEERDRYLER